MTDKPLSFDPPSFNVACIQYYASADIDADINLAEQLIADAVAAGAGLVVLPELCAGLAITDGNLRPVAFPPEKHPALERLSAFARAQLVEVLIGSLAVEENGQLRNRSFHVDRTGKVIAQYDKIHMFDIDLGPGRSYRESATFTPGDQGILTRTHDVSAGMAVCYDLRFPELFRDYATAGAGILFLPAAFTQTTGEAHWHSLLRARAIENGAYVIAAGQCGSGPNGAMFGHSLIIDPWGCVLADAGANEGFCLAAVNPQKIRTTREKIPALANRRVYSIELPEK